jgi:hypothetical protein
MAVIRETQNEQESLRDRIAANHFYRNAKWIHFTGATVAILMAIASPFVLLFEPGWGPTLGAIGGLWIFVSRVVLEHLTREYKLNGAVAQERFDCRVLGFEWNDSLAGRLSDEEIRAASRSMKNAENARDWYPAADDHPWPQSVLICQRANTVWARRQHRTYSRVVIVGAVVWFVVGLIVAGADSASLTAYLVTILLPSLPAFLDTLELSRSHAAASGARRIVEDQTNRFLDNGDATYSDLREIQDQMFNLRRDAPLVPQWFYDLIRPGYEDDMQFAAGKAAKSGRR